MGAHTWDRTRGLRFRKPSLYPTELCELSGEGTRLLEVYRGTDGKGKRATLAPFWAPKMSLEAISPEHLIFLAPFFRGRGSNKMPRLTGVGA